MFLSPSLFTHMYLCRFMPKFIHKCRRKNYQLFRYLMVLNHESKPLIAIICSDEIRRWISTNRSEKAKQVSNESKIRNYIILFVHCAIDWIAPNQKQNQLDKSDWNCRSVTCFLEVFLFWILSFLNNKKKWTRNFAKYSTITHLY